jgi:hypothetical protein
VGRRVRGDGAARRALALSSLAVADWWSDGVALSLEWRLKRVRKTTGRTIKKRAAKRGGVVRRYFGRRPTGEAPWRTLRILGRPGVERRMNDLFWLLDRRAKWTGKPNLPSYVPGRRLLIELDADLYNNVSIREFARTCTFWEPQLALLSSPPPSAPKRPAGLRAKPKTSASSSPSAAVRLENGDRATPPSTRGRRARASSRPRRKRAKKSPSTSRRRRRAPKPTS